MSRLTPGNVERAQQIIARYPRRRSALIPLLHLAQEQDGYITEDAMAHLAELVDTTPAEVLGTASFYGMFKREPVGRYVIGICTNIACLLNGAYPLLEHAETALGVKVGDTTDDGMITLEDAECLAACGGAPCVQVNYRYFENVTAAQFDEIITGLGAGELLTDTVPQHGLLNRVTLPAPVTDAT